MCRLAGLDAAAVVEVIEHIDPARLRAFADAVFGTARQRAMILKTANAEYNAYENLPAEDMRHADRRFEWFRAELLVWVERTAASYGYETQIEGIGEPDPELGTPTQMAVFTCI